MEQTVKLQIDAKAKLEKSIANYKKSPKARLTKPYIETRLESLEQQWRIFIENHQRIVRGTQLEELCKSLYVTEEVYELSEELYIDFKCTLKTALCVYAPLTTVNVNSENCPNANCGSTVRLPKITIPTFSGKYTEWPTFRDLFTSLIHNDNTLDKVQKLHFLKGHLTGEAELLLRNIPICESNYDHCWSQLESRFNNKKYLSNCILKRLISQKNVSESSTCIKNLLDTTNECLAALSNIGIDICSWDVIVIYIISLKLDSETRKLWEAKCCEFVNELPTLNQFKLFLEQRFRSLEFLDTKASNVTRVNNIKTLYVSTPSCIFCTENHKLCYCKKFIKEDTESRRGFVRARGLCFNCLSANHAVYNCRLQTRCHICKKRHHSLLHPNNGSNLAKNASQSFQPLPENNVMPLHQDESNNVVSCFSDLTNQVLLATALVRVNSKCGSSMTFRALLDQGSQASFITEATVQALGLKKVSSQSIISGLGGNHTDTLTSKSTVTLKIQSLHDPNFIIDVKAHVLSRLTRLLPQHKIHANICKEFTGLNLADPAFYIPNKIDLLLGAEVFGQIILDGLVKGPLGAPIAQQTKLGWILSGQVNKRCNNSIVSLHGSINDTEILKKFWELESEESCVSKKRFLTEEEQRCEELFSTTTRRDDCGRYVVRLPLRSEDPACKYGESRIIAAQRFHSLEKRLSSNDELRKQYSDVIKEYLALGHMEVVPTAECNKSDAVYLPHHAVIRNDKTTTKLRVVFDASCIGTNGASLNSELMVGPKLQPDLRHIIMRWRLHPIVLVADIEKMYLQVKVAESDTDFQRLFWRDSGDPKSEMQHLRLTRVTFGTASAPYLAVRSLQQLAIDEGSDYPMVSARVLTDYYVDDLMTGCEDVGEGEQIYQDMTNLLHKGGFKLKKWATNNETLKNIIKEKRDDEIKIEPKADDIMKILGLIWNKYTDEFEYRIRLPPMKLPVTKRNVISDIARLYDPLGWISPIVVTAKIFIQKIWLSGVDWDDKLPENLLNEWLKYREELLSVAEFKIPRWLQTYNSYSEVELHGFCDASSDAFAAVVYLRATDKTNTTYVNLVTSKTKVAPVKQLSIPRLELCGAVLLAKLLTEVSSILNIPRENLHAWTDSSIVLAWLSSHPSRWKTFVANRVSEILTVMDSAQWSHVPSTENPADLASRGVKPSDLSCSRLWKRGPIYLQRTVKYNKQAVRETNLEERVKKACYAATLETTEDPLWGKFSTLRKLIRVLALCKRFAFSAREATRDHFRELPPWLTRTELNDVLYTCIRQCQAHHFKNDVENLQKNKTVTKGSKIASLNPFMDGTGLLRVGGRLQEATIGEATKHPIIIPRKSYLTDLIVAEAHEKTLHGGPQLMLTYLRSKYWIIDAKNLTKFFVRRCVTCTRYAARSVHPLMGQLPASRVTVNRPFYNSGVDYAGPINIRSAKGRGHKSYKGYICLFVCMATKAVHLEAVSDLSAQGFLAAFKRFVARRGHCANLWSDNGTNFVGAARELKRLFVAEKSSIAIEIANCLSSNGTQWHFIPPHAPNFGGLWEAGIKSTKYHLKRVIGDSKLTFEEMSTVLSQIEACLNSRPLMQVSCNPDDPSPLTPGHFLVGEPVVLAPDVNYENSNIGMLRRWQLTQHMIQSFWRRWSQEYLTQFLQRRKWKTQTPEPNIGDLVLIKEDNLPPARWLHGTIVQKHPGSDNITRVVSVKSKGAIIRRPISKICILPVM